MSPKPSLYPLRPLWALLLVALALVSPLPALAANDAVYTMENVQVDVTASDAATARNLAFMQAQQSAFKQLAIKLAGAGPAAHLKAPDDITLSTMVKDYETTAEQLSNVRYLGTYTVRFRGPATRAYLAHQGLGAAMASVAAGIPPVASDTTATTATTTETTTTSDSAGSQVQGKPLLVLPFYQANGQTTVWGDPNPWLAAWQKLPPAGTTPIVAPIGDAADIADLDGGTLTYDRAAMSRMTQRYGAGDVVLLLAAPGSATAGGAASPAPAVLSIALYRTDQDTPQIARRLTVTAQPDEAADLFYARAALAARAALQQDWKHGAASTVVSSTSDNSAAPRHGDAFAGVPATGVPGTAVSTTSVVETTTTRTTDAYSPNIPGRIHAEAHFAGLSQWLRLQRALRSTEGVTALHTGTLSPQGASVDFIYHGTPDALRISLTEAGIAALPSAPGVYDLRLAGGNGR